MAQLPPDLARLGDELVAAAARALERRRRRLARAAAGAVTLIALGAVVATGALTSASRRSLQLAERSDAGLSAVLVRPPARHSLRRVDVAERASGNHRTGSTVPVVVLRHME